VEANGLQGAPEVRVIAGEHAHLTITVACRMLGLGSDRIRTAAADDQGRMLPAALDEALAEHDGPTIVCAQAGEVNSGAFDPLEEIVAACRRHGAWCHVDGAFGLWAAASPAHRHLLAGFDAASSWATDGHKWLNVPYDCGIAIVADRAAHQAAMGPSTAAYIPAHEDETPWAVEWSPEFSRRARAVPLYAALRTLGRSGVADLVDRCCAHARHFAELLAAADGVEVLNDVVLNQVLVRFGDDDALTDEVVERVQQEGTCWLSGSTFRGRSVMRISVVGWQTTSADVEASAEAILAAFAARRGLGRTGRTPVSDSSPV
jgi:glutamate/tyrosine decarboxylase-like PLP-dependent enzyme